MKTKHVIVAALLLHACGSLSQRTALVEEDAAIIRGMFATAPVDVFSISATDLQGVNPQTVPPLLNPGLPQNPADRLVARGLVSSDALAELEERNRKIASNLSQMQLPARFRLLDERTLRARYTSTSLSEAVLSVSLPVTYAGGSRAIIFVANNAFRSGSAWGPAWLVGLRRTGQEWRFDWIEQLWIA